jgi:hypothetical protein
MENPVSQEQGRQQINSGAYAALHGSKVGMIIDIDRQGLSFRYFHDATHVQDDSNRDLTVSIFDQNGFSLQHLPCRVIRDDSMLSEYTFSLVKMYKCTLQFEELTVDQHAQLEYFLMHFNDARK